MKNMKKLFQKAMVFTLTAAMLIGTPLTASAAGLVDLYQIEDGWGNVTGNEDNTRTGTVTATQTNSGILDANAQLAGIVLDETNVELEVPEETTLTASLDWGTEDGRAPEKYQALNDDLMKRLQWKSSDTAVVALRVENRSYNGGSREKITVVPKAVGTATVTVSLDSNEHNIHYSATATVTVVQYADDLKFNDEIKTDAVTGNSIVLADYVDRYVNGKIVKTSDTLTYAFKGDSKVATLKNGVLTLKKEGTVSVLAIGKKAKSDWYEITIGKGHNAKTIVFEGKNVTGTKLPWAINDGMTWDVTANVTATKDGDATCTDKISWSSKKPAIVDVSTTAPMKLQENKCTVELIAKSVGKGQIVAKASSGKSVTLNVTVSANLTSIEITEAAPTTLYSGQTVDLYDMATQKFADKGEDDFTDAGLKWTFVGDSAAQKPMKKVASINAKGVLTIKPDLGVNGGTDTIKVQAVNAKKVGDKKPGDIKSNELIIKLEQVNVTEITVNRVNTTETPVARAEAVNGKVSQKVKGAANSDTVATGGSKIYTLTAKGTIGDETEVHELDPAVLGWTASGNGKIVKAGRDAANNGVIRAINKGTATITINSATKKVSGTSTKYVAIKTTFKEKVTAPTKTLLLTVKNKGIAATGKKQTISITPVIQKGSTTNKSKDIVWTATKNGSPITIDKGKIKNIELGENDLGAKIVVTAAVKNGGPRTSVTLTVVKPSKNVEFQVNETKVTSIKDLKTSETEARVVTAKVNLTPSGVGDPGKENVSNVTYTVNKTGIVRVVDNSDGTISIEPLTKGSVKITATTLDGKKGTLSLKVVD